MTQRLEPIAMELEVLQKIASEIEKKYFKLFFFFKDSALKLSTKLETVLKIKWKTELSNHMKKQMKNKECSFYLWVQINIPAEIFLLAAYSS